MDDDDCSCKVRPYFALPDHGTLSERAIDRTHDHGQPYIRIHPLDYNRTGVLWPRCGAIIASVASSVRRPTRVRAMGVGKPGRKLTQSLLFFPIFVREG